MAKTANLGLNLTTDDNTKFKDWRKTIDGDENSNMKIIDEAIGAINARLNNMEGNSSFSEVSNDAGGTTVTIS